MVCRPQATTTVFAKQNYVQTVPLKLYIACEIDDHNTFRCEVYLCKNFRIKEGETVDSKY